MTLPGSRRPKELTWWQAAGVGLSAAITFHLANALPELAFLIALYFFLLLPLVFCGSAGRVLVAGCLTGATVYLPYLGFLWSMYGVLSLLFWALLAFWVGLFVLLAYASLEKLGWLKTAVLAPFIWTGIEYFRTELFYLRFPWAHTGYAFASSPQLQWVVAGGIYAAVFVMVLLAAVVFLMPGKWRVIAAVTCLGGLGVFTNWPREPGNRGYAAVVQVAGAQLERPSEEEVLRMLDLMAQLHPEAEMLVLSEKTFEGDVPVRVREWCRMRKRYLVVGGAAPLKGEALRTAFVVAPSGEVVFQQGAAVPGLFRGEGRAASAEQRIWSSPWGRIGICMFNDLNFSWVTDSLIRQGAQALVVPALEPARWGALEHYLHSRIPPVRAAEYGIPVFKVASSGISLLVDGTGRILASAGFPGSGETLGGPMELPVAARLPIGRKLASISVLVTAALVLSFFLSSLFEGPAPRGKSRKIPVSISDPKGS
jgi:apolipoprotein N-acyltransferase